MPTSTVTVDVRLTPDDLRAALERDVRQGLTSDPKDIPPKWFYDDRGSELFDAITRLPEYYPTRTEAAILTEHADLIASVSQADTLVELGSGTSEKTQLLLAALSSTGQLTRFVPFDVSEGILRFAAETINRDYPDVAVHAIVGDFEHHLRAIPPDGRRLFAFLGGTIGNLVPRERASFLRGLTATMNDGDHLLIGFDLVKDVERIEAAYNDASGVTAAFNRNLLTVLNRELDADFDLDAFEHEAAFDPVHEWIEMHLRATRDVTLRVGALGLEVPFARDERMRTEVSAKFRPGRIEAELRRAGLTVDALLTDGAGDFALALASPDQPRR